MNQFYCKFPRLLKKWQACFSVSCTIVLLTLFSFSLRAQTTLSATASSGSAYSVITAAGFAHENPDCVHGSFGAHVTQAFDAQLNKNVFVFHSHIVDDNDRCTNFDRVRMEIKGNNSTTQHTEGQTAYYRWKFKLDANFIGGSSFCHIFQIKAYTGDAGAPLITITPRATVLEILHDGGDEAGSVDLGKLTSVPLAPFKGAWVEAYVKYTSSDNGSFEITLKRVSDGATLLSYSKTSGIDLWRTDGGHNRPKWGVYRSKNSSGLRDEQVRFADFCVSESSASQCPSSVGSGGGGGTFSGFYRLTPRHSGKALVVQSASTSNSAAVVQYTYGGSATNDEWELLSIGSGYYRIINRNSSKDMVVQSASTSDAANIIQYTYGGSTTNDEWQLVDNGDGYYRIVNRNSGKVVEVAGSSTADGAAAQQRTWNGGTNQQFQLESIAAAAQANASVKTTTAAIVNMLEPAALRFQNPTSGNTIIDLNLSEEGHTNLTVFDQVGRTVAVLVSGHLSKGRHRVTLDKQAITAGTYIIRLVQNGGQVSKQLIRQ